MIVPHDGPSACFARRSACGGDFTDSRWLQKGHLQVRSISKDADVVHIDEASTRAAALLAGPRGREVCAEVSSLIDPELTMPHEVADDASRTRLIEQLAGLDVCKIEALDEPLDLLDALGASVDSARYWQEPFGRDAVLADPQITSQFEPTARALAVAPAARWWWSPLDPSRQAVVRWLDRGRRRAAKPLIRGAAARLQLWRDDALADETRAAVERPDDPAASYSGYWWSTPTHADLVTTSRQLGSLPAVQLDLVEDSMGWERARVARVDPASHARVFEIAAPADWVELVTRYPLDVDRSRRHDWYRATRGSGPWQIPDWLAVSRDHDAVHLTVAGYLATAGRALATEHGWTILAGFDPDLTYWLTDTITLIATPATLTRTTSDGDHHEWVRET